MSDPEMIDPCSDGVKFVGPCRTRGYAKTCGSQGKEGPCSCSSCRLAEWPYGKPRKFQLNTLTADDEKHGEDRPRRLYYYFEDLAHLMTIEIGLRQSVRACWRARRGSQKSLRYRLLNVDG